MNSFLSRFRWAIALALLQGIIFASVGISEHRRSHRYGHSSDSTRMDYFGCIPLPHQRLSIELEQWDLRYVDCYPAASVRFVGLTNLPVFIIWFGLVGLTRNTNVDQYWLFYVINGFEIPVLWFCIGSLIDRRRRRHAAAVLNPPMEQD
jgi:hypothetical protein